MNSKPLVSIILPVYNGEDTIKETLESLLAQDFKAFELLICIDGTNDKSEEIVKGFEDNRIKLYKNHRNLGLGASLNRLIFLSSPQSRYIAIAEQDDYYYPQRLNLQVEYLERCPEMGLVSGIAEFFDGEKVSMLFPSLLANGKNYPEGKEMFLFTYRDQIKVVNSCMMIRKKTHIVNGLYFTTHQPSISVDWTYILRFSLISKIGGIPEILVRLDRSSGRKSVTTDKRRQFRAARELLINFKYEQPLLISEKDYKYAFTTQHLLELGHYSKSRFIFSFLSFFFSNPFDKRWKQYFKKRVKNILKQKNPCTK